MSIAEMKSFPEDPNKFYISVNLSEHREVFEGVLSHKGSTYEIAPCVVDELCKKSGIPTNMSKILKCKDKNLWIENNILLYNYYYNSAPLVYLVVDNSVEYITSKSIPPVLNTEFLRVAGSFFEDYGYLVDMDSYSYDQSRTISEFTVFKREKHNYAGRDYILGVLFTNDELSNISCTLVAEVDGIRFYLPSKYYNLSSSRYSRSTSNSIEAFQMLLLRVIEDISDENWYSIIPEVNTNIVSCQRTPATYEDYKRLSQLVNKSAINSDISEGEIKDILESLEDTLADFEKNYSDPDSMNKSYIWRCSALSEHTIYDLIVSLISTTRAHEYYPETMRDIFKSIGDMIMLDNIATELAKRKG